MKKTVLLLAFCIICRSSFGQSVTQQQKYYYTCKVFGFVKYYHSGVSNCSVNWDSVLVSVLPAIDTATTKNGFNDILDTMLLAAGPMALATTPLPDTLPPALKRNRNFGWIGDSIFRSDVQVALDTIKNNFRPHPGCNIQNNTFTSSYYGYLVFPNDMPELNINTTVSYPDEYHRLLMFFKYWNIVNYFYPYNYSLDIPWDTTLNNYSIAIGSVGDSYDLFLLYQKITAALNDAHVEGLTWSNDYNQPPGLYQPKAILRYIDGNYVVVKTSIPGINTGDAIISIDGRTTAQWEDSVGQYISAGNPSVYRRFIYDYYLLAREAYNTHETLVVQDSTGATNTINVTCNGNPNTDTAFFNYWYDYYPADSLRTISWTTMPCDIGYVNMGNLQSTDVNTMYAALQNKPAIIFDLRNYPNGTGPQIADLMFPAAMPFAKFTIPDVTYPGTYYWEYDSLGVNGNTTPYNGKVILLMNEQTQSQAEFTCMTFAIMPDVVKVGSQTAGTDGDISYWYLSQEMQTGFTSLGIYYPNGDSTERIGIVPDTVVNPTRAGIRHGRDEVLEKALSIADCMLATPVVSANAPIVKVFPNPANEVANVQLSNINSDNVTIQFTDVMGRVLIEKTISANGQNIYGAVDITALPPGIYFVKINADKQYVTKLVKQ